MDWTKLDFATKMNKDIQKFFNILNGSKSPGFDVETNGLRWQNCYVCGYSVSDGREAVYIPVRHAMDRGGDGNIPDPLTFERELANCIDKHPGKIVGHNIKFDMHFSQNHNVKIGNKVKDTMVRAALINENKISYSLANVAREYPIVQKKGQELYEHISRLVGCKADSNSMAHFHRLSGDDLLAHDYAGTDTVTTKQLFDKQEETIYKENLDVVEGMESELTYVLQKMERQGIKVDIEEYEKVKEKVSEMHLEAYAQLPLNENLEPLNVRSGKELKAYFEWCEIDDWPFTEPTDRYPEGQPSFNKDWLGNSDEGLYILEARKYDHLISSFINPFPNFIHNSKINCTFNQSRSELGGARPGRLSCMDPNLQQVPKRDKVLGRIYRNIFIPEDEFILVEFDHSQAEPRIYSHYSGEPSLIEGYNKTPFVDMHSIVAQMLNISRDDAKHLNLGMLYTMGSKKLAKKLKCAEGQARDYVYRWHRAFPMASNFTKRAEQVAADRGYVRTILGRRARFPDVRFAYRAANRIIQGSSADILKWKMVQINRWIEYNKYDGVVQLLLNIHDAIVVQVHKEYTHLIPKIQDIFQTVQEAPFNLRVPFYADYHEGKNWSEASYGK